MKLLVVEDEKNLLDSVVKYLNSEGFLCEQASDFFTAEDKMAAFQYDAIILDITLPDGNGLDLLKQLKENNPETGVLIVSARNALEDRIKGLDLGADDYITKPFHLSELHSRIRAILRRRKFEGTQTVSFHEIQINPELREVIINHNPIILTPKEYELLLYFITNRGHVLTRQSIAEHLWGDYMDTANHFDFVYTHMNNLRKKIKKAGGQDYVKTVYGIGYKFTD